MKSVQVEFEFKTFKEQIEEEILRLKKSWKEDMEEDEFWNRKYPESPQREISKAYAILVNIELYNKIREIYTCDIPFPHDTPELLGLIVNTFKESKWRPLFIVDKKYYENNQK